MKRNPLRTQDRFVEVAEGFRQRTPRRLESVLAKRQKMQIRVSETDKEEIAATAKWLQLTATEYLLRLHFLASELLRRRMQKTKGSR
jgi:hypothetical protein